MAFPTKPIKFLAASTRTWVGTISVQGALRFPRRAEAGYGESMNTGFEKLHVYGAHQAKFEIESLCFRPQQLQDCEGTRRTLYLSDP